MVHLINAQYNILDVFEKNPFQNLMLGSDIDCPEDIAVINEVRWSPLFTHELAQSLYEGFINLKNHSEDDVSCQLVTAYHKGTPISKYLSSRSLSFRNRINLCYEFLKDMVSYEAFPSWIQDILIDEDQIIVWEDQLRYNELLVLKTSAAEDVQGITFEKVQKKIHQITKKLIGTSSEASPALLSFMERLGTNGSGFGSLQEIYDDFQKVYLYDYYLNQNDTVQTPPAIVPVPVILPEAPEAEPVAASLPEEDETAAPPAEEVSEEDIIPILPLFQEEVSAEEIPPVEMDSVDADMEKNLELFFNRDRQQSEGAEESDARTEKRRNWLWLLLGCAAVGLIIWAAASAFMPGGKPVAAFSSTEENGIWVLKNQSTFTEAAAVKRCEWTVYQNGKLIDLYDTYDLTLALEEPGAYQVVLRVMDHDGNWSALYQETLNNRIGTAASGNTAPPANTGTGEEKMDRFTLKFSPDRTQKDTAFFRTGSYSLQISAGKKPEILDVQGVKLDKNGMVSFWISSENTEAVTMTFTGYNQNAKMFTKEVSHQPLASRQWEMRQFTVEAEQSVNRMTVAVRTEALINLDDLSIESYK